MKFKTINPATEEIIAEFETMSRNEVLAIASSCRMAYHGWRNTDLALRTSIILELAKVLRKNSNDYAKLITLEMGKPIKESVAEIEKCAWTAEVYAENAEDWLHPRKITADGRLHQVEYEPIGTILSIMPWNFPFWQALRFAIPTLIAGNVTILKHSSITPQCSLAIEEAFQEAGFPQNTFRTIIAGHDTVTELISSELIQGVSLTGSTNAGRRIGEIAGKNLKKLVLELGGSDPFIVLDDCDIDSTAKNAVLGRTLNTGQSCIAAKRFIVLELVAEEFIDKFTECMNLLKIGNPMSPETDVGPLADANAMAQIEEQVGDAINKGAKVLTGGERFGEIGYFYKPTILSNVNQNMKVATEEVFGPVAPVIIVKDENEAIKIANSTVFGLGASVWTGDLERGINMARKIESGTVFVNNITKSDPRMPFGGIKGSGIGRELSEYGLKEFVNIKGLNVYDSYL